PIALLPPEVAQKVLEGSRVVCAEAGITLAGGHSIDCPEPVFGLAVNGIVPISQLKRNATAEAGCRLYLTKSLGVGILSTARKRGVLLPEDADIALASMVKLNSLGEKFGKLSQVKAMTDVTGFGLLGHLMEMCDGSNLSATIAFDSIPVIPNLSGYLSQGCVPGGTQRNWSSYGHKVSVLTDEQRDVLADPQTSGGLLVAVSEDGVEEFEALLKREGLASSHCQSFGWLSRRNGLPIVKII
ncbi:MAG: selenide, water dikinase SelD, partial [Chitinophagaceae bacterium]